MLLHLYLDREIFINATSQSSALGLKDGVVQGDMITPSHVNQLAATSAPDAVGKRMDG